MANNLSYEIRKQIYELGKHKLSQRQIARDLGITRDAVAVWINRKPEAPKAAVEIPESDLHAEIRKILKKTPQSHSELSDTLDRGAKVIKEAIAQMTAKGALLGQNAAGQYFFQESMAQAPGKVEIVAPKSGHGDGEWTHVFGAISDNHLCNKHSRLDVMNAAYETFARMGITTVYNAGNWIDGEARFNKSELVTAPGVDNQLDYMIDKYPHHKGITTHYIAGDDHEGWYSQREGIEIGKYLQYRAEEQGRHDLKYLGYAEADIALRCGTGTAVGRVVHPGGGSSYAVSYTDQKRVESYQGGEKPSFELAGHYHKWNYGYPREVHTVQVGCTEDQTLFMRKKRLQAHVGFSVIRIKQDSKDGHITRFSPEWHPFFDRGYYEKRY